MNKKIVLIFVFVAFGIFLLSSVSAVCCEKTIAVSGTATRAGAFCQDVIDISSCDRSSGLRTAPTSCQSTDYCSRGTCVNSESGTCMPSPKATCQSELGGYWYNKTKTEQIPRCEMGCCIIGNGGSISRKIKCEAAASDYNADYEFSPGILDLEVCLSKLDSKKKGACVVETEQGRKCTIELGENCQSPKEFHAGLLCTAPDLGCVRTSKTMCAEGKEDVYFADSCGNPANVYDSSKATDTTYWTYIKEDSSSDLCGTGDSNINSQTCGNCNYGLGSICGKTGGKSICKDLRCTYKGVTYNHGQTWCSEPIKNFETATPGKLSYVLSCMNGEVTPTLCGNGWREELCWENSTVKYATCIANRWDFCIIQNNSKDCLNKDMRDCRVEEGTEIVDANNKEKLFIKWDGETKQEIKAACVPKYPPAFNFWNPDSTTAGSQGASNTPNGVCGRASTICTALYSQNFGLAWTPYEYECASACKSTCEGWIIGKGLCEENCFAKCPKSECYENYGTAGGKLIDGKIKKEWATQRQELCISMGDCGVKANYLDKEGYSSWKDLFIGNYTKSDLPNADAYK